MAVARSSDPSSSLTRMQAAVLRTLSPVASMPEQVPAARKHSIGQSLDGHRQHCRHPAAAAQRSVDPQSSALRRSMPDWAQSSVAAGPGLAMGLTERGLMVYLEL